MPTTIRAVVFDAVGTLIHADPPVADVYHLVGWQHGSQLSRDEVAARLREEFVASEAGEDLSRQPTSEPIERERWRRIVSAVFSDVPDAGPIFRILWEHFSRPEHWRLYGDVAFTISELADRGYRLAIASNFDRRLHAIRTGLPILEKCERCFVSSEIGFPKPDPRFFADIEQQLGLSPAEILLIGDDWTNDILGAQAASWRTVFLKRRGRASEKAAIHSLGELLDRDELRGDP